MKPGGRRYTIASDLPMRTLIISDQIVGPPTWLSSFRDLTLYCAVFIRSPVVIEAADPDPCYRWLKPKGGMDFVEDFVRPGSERGLRLAPRRIDYDTVVVGRIVPENMNDLLRRIKGPLAA